MITITKEFRFEMAHALDRYDGLCRFIHGHSYKLVVTVAGIINKSGFVLDFTEIKARVNAEIIREFDHSLMLKKNGEMHKLLNPVLSGTELSERIRLVPFNPTAENMAKYFMFRLSDTINVVELTLYETETSFATVKK